LSWIDGTTGYHEVFYKRSMNGGVNWTTKRLTSNSESYLLDISVDSGNTIHVAWQDFKPGNYDIFYRKGIQ
jgi:hypothetical protein